MQVIVCKNYEEMSEKAASLAAAAIQSKPQGLVSFPGGSTPVGMVGQFVHMVNQGKVDISKAHYVSLDEWVGLAQTDEGSCGLFNRQNLLTPLAHSFAGVHIIDGAASDIEKERQALDGYIEKWGPLTVSVLGIGMNGHLGFNEAGVDVGLNAHIIPLDDVTKTVMKKYFGEAHHPEYGITQGIAQIMAAETVILIADGEKKAGIVAKAVKGPVSNAVPASVLQNHPNCFVVLDEAAASGL